MDGVSPDARTDHSGRRHGAVRRIRVWETEEMEPVNKHMGDAKTVGESAHHHLTDNAWGSQGECADGFAAGATDHPGRRPLTACARAPKVIRPVASVGRSARIWSLSRALLSSVIARSCFPTLGPPRMVVQ